jgi:transcriptional regulator with XRE-family HTH domain
MWVTPSSSARWMVQAAAAGIRAGHGHRAEADPGNVQSPQRDVLHQCLLVVLGSGAVIALCRCCTATEPRAGRGVGAPDDGATDRDPQPQSRARMVDGMAGGNSSPDTGEGIPSEARRSVRGEIQTFLTTRRARISPEQAGLPTYGAERRRVSGLRRDEVAVLAGISSQYYTKLERGNAAGVSDSVIDAIARALQLDEAERAHLVDLIRAAGTTRAPRRAPQQRVRSTVQRVLDSMIGTPALVLNARLDIVTANQLGTRCFHRSTPTPSGQPTTLDSYSSTGTPPSSSVTGTRRPTTRSRSCAPRPAAILTTGASLI